MAQAITDSLFLQACRRQPTPRTPAWMMRQAGRYMPEYQAVRAEAGGFLELCLNPDLAAKATLDAQRILQTDAAIIFSDITLPAQAMGVPLRFDPGPTFEKPIREANDVAALRMVDPQRDLAPVLEAVRITRQKLPADVSLIGFVGAPFTVASYMIEGAPTKNWVEAKRMLYGNRGLFDQLIDRLVESLTAHAQAQLDAGCDTVQFFDSHAGELAPRELEEVAFDATARCIAGLDRPHAPTIYFPRGANTHLERAVGVGCDVLALDWSVDLAEQVAALGSKVALMGNLDPLALLADESSVRRRTREIVTQGQKALGYIFNLGHGIVPQTPVSNAQAVIETVRNFPKN